MASSRCWLLDIRPSGLFSHSCCMFAATESSPFFVQDDIGDAYQAAKRQRVGKQEETWLDELRVLATKKVRQC